MSWADDLPPDLETDARFDRSDGGGKIVATMAPEPSTPWKSPGKKPGGCGGCLFRAVLLVLVLGGIYWFWTR